LKKNDHNWKFSPGDLKERLLWDDYMRYYEEAINATSTEKAPWFVIPADDKEMARYIVAAIIWKTMQQYTDIVEPELDDEIKAKAYEAQLRKEI
jgi:polyphosphate kinase 2 (PPK2 family)